jgi:alpha-N-arabinofuranosidase
VEVKGQDIRGYLDGKLILNQKYPAAKTLFAVAGLNKTKDEVILKVVNAAPIAQETDIHLAGVNNVQPLGTAIVLTADESAAENTLDNPTKVAPITQQFQNAGKDFSHSFPASSVSVLRLKIK